MHEIVVYYKINQSSIHLTSIYSEDICGEDQKLTVARNGASRLIFCISLQHTFHTCSAPCPHPCSHPSNQVLTIEKPEPEPILDPPPQPKPAQSAPGGKPPAPPSGSGTPSAAAATPSRAALPVSPLNGEYDGQRRGSFLGTSGRRTAPDTPMMRRYDSHSLLSDNSIASSRFDLSEGASYPKSVHALYLERLVTGAECVTLSPKVMGLSPYVKRPDCRNDVHFTLVWHLSSIIHFD